jgi:hypothetical protein
MSRWKHYSETKLGMLYNEEHQTLHAYKYNENYLLLLF